MGISFSRTTRDYYSDEIPQMQSWVSSVQRLKKHLWSESIFIVALGYFLYFPLNEKRYRGCVFLLWRTFCYFTWTKVSLVNSSLTECTLIWFSNSLGACWLSLANFESPRQWAFSKTRSLSARFPSTHKNSSTRCYLVSLLHIVVARGFWRMTHWPSLRSDVRCIAPIVPSFWGSKTLIIMVANRVIVAKKNGVFMSFEMQLFFTFRFKNLSDMQCSREEMWLAWTKWSDSHRARVGAKSEEIDSLANPSKIHLAGLKPN